MLLLGLMLCCVWEWMFDTLSVTQGTSWKFISFISSPICSSIIFKNGELYIPDWIYWEPTANIINTLNKVAHFLVRSDLSFCFTELCQICFHVIATHCSWFLFLKHHERALFLFYIIALVYLTFSMIHRDPY